jgi:peptide-methionine (R)-S-oxide reductase
MSNQPLTLTTLTRRRFFMLLPALAAAGTALVRADQAPAPGHLKKTDDQWRSLLPLDRYRVLFEEDTERPFSSPLNHEKETGKFICAACFLPLFDSSRKFDSGTGWPSFWDVLPGAVESKSDFKLIVKRTEYHCARCGGHQGHVFDDGPKPTGLRYCNNGLALQFVATGAALPALRT